MKRERKRVHARARARAWPRKREEMREGGEDRERERERELPVCYCHSSPNIVDQLYDNVPTLKSIPVCLNSLNFNQHTVRVWRGKGEKKGGIAA